MNTARKLRNAAGAQSQLKALLHDLLVDENDLDAAQVRHCGEVLAGVIGRIVTGRTQVQAVCDG